MRKTLFLLPISLFFLAANCNATAEKEKSTVQSSAQGSTEDWDLETLKRHGLAADVMENLDRLGKIPAGTNVVDISLNGDFMGSFQLRVTPQGVICFTPEILEEMGLPFPDTARSDGCYDWANSDNQISLAWQQETQSLSIVVPAVWRVNRRQEGETGGTALGINYNYFSSLNISREQRNGYSWLTLDSSLNVHNWMLHSQQNFQQDDEGLTTTVNSTYLEHYLSKLNKTFEIGEITVHNTLFALDTIKGVQLSPDYILSEDNDGGNGVVVEGSANTPQARVEVRQYDQLVYTTLVPAGPFSLDNIPVQNLNAPLNVTVVETHGASQQFVVPVTQLRRFTRGTPPGYSLAVGKIQNVPDGRGVPAILTLNQNWQPGAWWSLRNGALLSERYHSVALALDGVPPILAGKASFSLQAIAEQNSYHHSNGLQLLLSGNHNLTRNVSLSAGLSKNSPTFVTLNEAMLGSAEQKNHQNTELSLSINWSPQWLGSLSLSHSRTRSYQNARLWRYTMLNWNRRIGQNLRLSLSASTGSGGKQKNKNIMLNVNWSMGEKHFRHYYRSYNHREVVGSEINGHLSDSSDYNLSVEQDNSDRTRSVQAALNSDMRYTRLSLSAQRDNRHFSNYTLGVQGAVALYPYGVGFSNNLLSDTYGVLALNKPLAGVPIITSGGTAWTDWRGKAILPYIPPWQDSSLNIDVDKLPKNIDVINGHRTLHLARGTFKKVQMTLLTGIRLLITARLADGRLLPKGSTLWEEDRIVAEAVDEGVIFLSNAANKANLNVKIAHSTEQCTLSYQLSDEQDDDKMLYKKIEVTCQ